MPRHRLAAAAWFTLLALPILVADNIPRTDAKASQAKVATVAPVTPTTTTTVPVTVPTTITAPATVEPEPSPTSTPPATTAPPEPTPTTARPAATLAAPAPATTAPATTAPPATAPLQTFATTGNSEDGEASFYDYNRGECAHKTIPKGTIVTVTNVANGATTSCVVTDRGPFVAGRIIDLDRSGFAAISSTSTGVITVHITW
ncbi:MAG: septal ring lytic transglycosylase RlpA family protein [Acidimicrobiales bacterium]